MSSTSGKQVHEFRVVVFLLQATIALGAALVFGWVARRDEHRPGALGPSRISDQPTSSRISSATRAGW